MASIPLRESDGVLQMERNSDCIKNLVKVTEWHHNIIEGIFLAMISYHMYGCIGEACEHIRTYHMWISAMCSFQDFEAGCLIGVPVTACDMD